ncbi:DNA repair RAD52-like protein 2, chloroplastic [Tasmannia lanceolata]|uniref:DNA repair RAD52-like protein 2, chloroplastic n=1 Tax=Tasmannia lanceolata TaxID=3420 RepID=UPI004064626D
MSDEQSLPFSLLMETITFLPRPVFPCSAVSSSTSRVQRRRGSSSVVFALDKNPNTSNISSKGVPNSNYVVPFDRSSSCITRPLAEILRDLNKRVPDKIIKPHHKTIPWFHANRMLSFYAPGWCGEICDVIFSDNESVTVVYRVTIRGSDAEAHRESTGTVFSNDDQIEDPVAAAEEIAFCRACARFGLGLYLYHEDENHEIL